MVLKLGFSCSFFKLIFLKRKYQYFKLIVEIMILELERFIFLQVFIFETKIQWDLISLDNIKIKKFLNFLRTFQCINCMYHQNWLYQGNILLPAWVHRVVSYYHVQLRLVKHWTHREVRVECMQKRQQWTNNRNFCTIHFFRDPLCLILMKSHFSYTFAIRRMSSPLLGSWKV